MMKYEKGIKSNNDWITGYEDDKRSMEQELDGRSESSIIRY